ncbi:hypothetical protein DUT91_08950 [Phyllobacterium salinisoli]|uniref:Uncharacterized protein n=2 Tax=Phyllobacterium salinisoli TaxID=1899321 RepID=A0A368K584_9HYPH|nr:hypothetical protein [Phyllobacterium salinisoli]RCS24391.1 hypothetical protein DUT91_08950 [Phyllobacterium salinisoli]
MLAPLGACAITSGEPSSTSSRPTINPLPRFMPQPLRTQVDPELARPCIAAAADKYFLPESAISAVDSRSAGDNTAVSLKVDLRTALCTVSSSGTVRSVVDTSPKSADQAAAEEAARKRDMAPAAKPAMNKKKKNS